MLPTPAPARSGLRTVPLGTVPDRVRAGIPVWRDVLSGADAARRPDESTWSPLEYACHVRDVCHLFDERLLLMLEQDDPVFPDWDQDEAAVAHLVDRGGDPVQVAALPPRPGAVLGLQRTADQ